MELSIEEALTTDGVEECLQTDPPQLTISLSRNPTFVLHADSENERDITITFGSSTPARLFKPSPPTVVVLAPDESLELTLREDADLDSLKFETDPAQRCGDGDLHDVIIES